MDNEIQQIKKWQQGYTPKNNSNLKEKAVEHIFSRVSSFPDPDQVSLLG
jgi:hypothetical protein